MDDMVLQQYIRANLERQTKKILRNGLIGVSVLSRNSRVTFICTLPCCLAMPNKSFNTAVEAAKYYNKIVKKYFDKLAVTCDIQAAQDLDRKYDRKQLP